MEKKLISFYLPQYYEFEENNKWWGKGFTEWTNVKSAKPLYKGHIQPTEPLNDNYYTLDNVEVMKWQIEMAKAAGIYGFCFYEYWFGDGKTLMEKPIEMYLKNKELDFPFCLCWANHNWTRTWTGGDTDILMEVKYGGEKEWRLYFEYLKPFFLDKRYIKKDNKLLFIIYMPELIPNLKEMKTLFNKWAKEIGFEGIVFVSQAPNVAINRKKYDGLIDYSILYEPNYTQESIRKKLVDGNIVSAICDSPSITFNIVCNALKKKINCYICNNKIQKLNLTIYSYKGLCKAIARRKCNDNKYFRGVFVGFDNTPRKGYGGSVYKGSSPDIFMNTLKKIVNGNDTENYVFIMAWNEWGEGAYLEPDKTHEYAYLDAIKRVIKCKKHEH